MDDAGAQMANAEPDATDAPLLTDHPASSEAGAEALEIEVRPAEDILAIDAVSFACRAGQVAAAEIFMLLEGIDQMHAIVWYRSGQLPPQPDHRTFEVVEREVNELAAYVCQRESNDGERLRIYAHSQGMEVAGGLWIHQSLPTRMAFTVFAETCLSVYRTIDRTQAAERAARAIEAAAPNPGLKREDSIFEETESLGELIPGVLEGFAASERQRAKAARVAVIDAPGSGAIGVALSIGRPEPD